MKRRSFIQQVAVLGSGLALAPAAWANEPIVLTQDVNFKPVNRPQSIAPYSKKVVEVFGYSCPHCYHLEHSLNDWLKSKSDDIYFERMPVVFNNPVWIFMARVFYTAQELNVLDQSHTPFFNAIHRDHLRITSVEDVAAFFEQFGIKKQDFIDTFKGFKVEQLVRKAAELTADYGIEGVPAMVVNGKYITDVPMAGSRAKMWQVVELLTQR
ncbi:thiol:disulfide interchange protein DsbA/DsbL [Thiomicrorhabdus sp.]|uniref:thiol:disulfide interchange protein DsbA/DsbL n=1 Tax=Thiomicrorhabdus sp. TaxID=2039724 RepID=UPI0029C9A596|nr:thiol:disulfide interchange protein DsbA/DsbL [Thiomicrorhabdus sp.]